MAPSGGRSRAIKQQKGGVLQERGNILPGWNNPEPSCATCWKVHRACCSDLICLFPQPSKLGTFAPLCQEAAAGTLGTQVGTAARKTLQHSRQ